MSRSNTYYYNLCVRHGEVGEDGFCDFHRGFWRLHGKCILPREWLSRRGIERRKPRFRYSPKTYQKGPPRWWWQMEHRRARRKQQAEFLRNPEDPMITPQRRLIDLWGWY